MFQFPGFALIPLCIQGKSTWFSDLLIACANNRQLSGGLPHSEIRGSKVILTSPRLIAEYHVLHRLLLPRHPPNALFALDPIQKEQNSFRSKVILTAFLLVQKECYSVSVLDLEQNRLRTRSP